MGMALSTFTVLMNIWEKGQHSERNQNSELFPVFGRFVNETYETTRIIEKQFIQNELNQNKSETMDSSWHGHCQFFADCTDCQRFKTEPDNADKTTQALQINDSVESNSGNTTSQARHSSNDFVIVNTSESCKRIKPTSQNIFSTSD